MLRVLTIFGVTVIVSVAAARGFIAPNPPPWPVTEYSAFALWSVPLAVLAAVLVSMLSRALALQSLGLRTIAAVPFGVLLGVLYAYAAYYGTGGYVLAFDFPVLYCWVTGALSGSCIGLLWPSGPQLRRRERAA